MYCFPHASQPCVHRPCFTFACTNQSCFRARLTAKPWRTGIAGNICPRPGVWPVRPELAAVRNEWVANYEARAAAFAACRYIESMGSGDITVAAIPPPQQPGPRPSGRNQRHDLIAVDHLPGFVDHDQPVSVAIERNADMGAVGDGLSGEIGKISHRLILPQCLQAACKPLQVACVLKPSLKHLES